MWVDVHYLFTMNVYVADTSVDKVHVMSVGIYNDGNSTFEFGSDQSVQTVWPPSEYSYSTPDMWILYKMPQI